MCGTTLAKAVREVEDQLAVADTETALEALRRKLLKLISQRYSK